MTIAITSTLVINELHPCNKLSGDACDIVKSVFDFVSARAKHGVKENVEFAFDNTMIARNQEIRDSVSKFLEISSRLDEICMSLRASSHDKSIGILDPDLNIWESSKNLVEILDDVSKQIDDAILSIQNSQFDRAILSETICLVKVLSWSVRSLSEKVSVISELISVHDSLMMPATNKTGIAELDALNA